MGILNQPKYTFKNLNKTVEFCIMLPQKHSIFQPTVIRKLERLV